MTDIAIIEDNAAEAKGLEALINAYSAENGAALGVYRYADAKAFFAEFRPHRFGIVFMDIEMPGMNGMEAARNIRKTDDGVIIVFVTNMAQFAIDGYSVGALDYILKPVAPFDFRVKLKRALDCLARRGSVAITLKNAGGTYRVDTADILYVEVLDYNLTYRLKKESISVVGRMCDAEKELAPLGFFKCHRSYLCNLRHVESVTDDGVRIGGTEIPLSRLRKREFVAALTEYLGGTV